MGELRELVSFWAERHCKEMLLLGTVVSTQGSTYRKAGARVLISESGAVCGMISGGCIESDLISTGFDRISDGPCLVEFNASDQYDKYFGFGTGCEGSSVVLLESLSKDGGIISEFDKLLKNRKRLSVSIHFDSVERKSWYVGHSSSTTSTCVLRQNILPEPRLTIVGAGQDVIPLLKFAKELGWYVSIVTGKGGSSIGEKFRCADEILIQAPNQKLPEIWFKEDSFHAVVLMSHSYIIDLEILKTLHNQKIDYLGVLGPKQRTEMLIQEAQSILPAIHSPVGLKIGGDNPAEIAISIVAEIQSLIYGK